MRHKWITVDEVTQRYLDVVSGKRGNAALVAWLRFTGWKQGVRTSAEKEFWGIYVGGNKPRERAREEAEPENQRYQISITARLDKARRNAWAYKLLRSRRHKALAA